TIQKARTDLRPFTKACRNWAGVLAAMYGLTPAGARITRCLSLTVCRTRSSYSSGLGVASLLPSSTVNLTVARHRCAVAARADPMGMDPPYDCGGRVTS